CGWSPPAGASALPLNCTSGGAGVPATYGVAPVTRASALPPGEGLLEFIVELIRLCECDGISDSSSVTVSEPPVSPRSCSDRPGPCPGCIGALPCRSGSAKVDLPSPP